MKIFFYLDLFFPLDDICLNYSVVFLCGLSYRAGPNDMPHDYLFLFVLFCLLEDISWINRFFSIAIPHKYGKWVIVLVISTFIVLEI